MTTHLVLDKAGRVVIPKPIREELHLEPGDSLQMDNTGEHITLRPLRGTGPLAKEHGVWVFRTGNALPASVTDDLLQRIRDERDEANLGEKKSGGKNRGETVRGEKATRARAGATTTSKGSHRSQ
ncbi:MAG: AbrB/MazE/SpoVT family DNA-binding domain-containing protein [Terriglobales bacterium]|jgi:AbrB family looped-hinge helix DNA binding protein